MSKIVQIQDLLPVEKKFQCRVPDAKRSLERIKCHHYKDSPDCKCNTLYYIENVESNYYAHQNSFYGAFASAYNNHEDIVLSVNDIWLVICFQFSKYVNNNSEKMRDLCVSHNNKKKLTIVTKNEESESEWNEFFELMIPAIRNNTKEGLVDSLLCDFSVTKQIESIISVATIMDSLKEYFDYGRMIPCCGIKAVRFIGLESDWNRLLDKVINLEKYDIDGNWKKYIQNMIPIINQFIDTFNGKIDLDFWNSVLQEEHKKLGSGGVTYVSGWILNFFGLSGKVEDEEILGYRFDFPVEIENRMTSEKKTVYIIGGFNGINYSDGAYSPQLSMIVHHDGATERLL